MNFGGMLQPVSFSGKPAGDRVPSPVIVRTKSRRLAALKEAADVVHVLPKPGESLHAIMTGRYDLTDLIDVVLAKLGAAKHLRVATLSFNRHNVQQMQAWLGKGQVKRLSVLCSLFFFEHNPDTYGELLTYLQARGNKLAATRNHCKVCCFEFRDGTKLALEGSANLRTNSNREQFCIVNCAKLHDWHSAWIDEECSRGKEVNTGDRGKAGRRSPADHPSRRRDQ